MKKGGTLFTMTYYGSQMVVKNYNIMGVAKRVLESAVHCPGQDRNCVVENLAPPSIFKNNPRNSVVVIDKSAGDFR